ncbi:MAG: hypothetical protein LBU27_06525 [Candidatus Peribacteria bacterium]|nr:hypothetical protein [Candidatus Peribacteria bacterium]
MAGTQILMADGSLKAIETITTGDQLMGAHSINTVLIPLKIKWANRPLYAINDSAYFVTESHPFMTTQGWKAIDVVAAKKENPDLEITPLVVGDVLITVDNGQQLVERISIQTLPWTSFVYNFMIDGDNTYYANGYLVHNKQDAEEYYQ